MNPKDLKLVIKEKYGNIVQPAGNTVKSSCCGDSSGCCGSGFTMASGDYSTLEGYDPNADYGLGCGIPTQFAGIRKGDDVLDLGSGAGNDCFVARAITGETGSVTGLDFTAEMVAKASDNNKRLGYANVKFVNGDIEDMPLPDNSFDVVVSNCVLNLVPDKNRASAQIMRVLKPGGHFCISDVVTKGKLPEKIRKDVEMYVGCVSGAIEKDEYLRIIANQGFKKITVHKESEIEISGDLLKESGSKVLSITVSGCKS